MSGKTLYMETFVIGFIYEVSQSVKSWEVPSGSIGLRGGSHHSTGCVPIRSWVLRPAACKSCIQTSFRERLGDEHFGLFLMHQALWGQPGQCPSVPANSPFLFVRVLMDLGCKPYCFSQLGMLRFHPFGGSLNCWGSRQVIQTFYSPERKQELDIPS